MPAMSPEKLEQNCNAILDVVMPKLPEGVGCTVFLFNYGENEAISFATTAKKHQMLTAIRNWIRRQSIEVVSS